MTTTITETYEQLNARYRKEFDKVMNTPDVFFAFSNDQFDEGLAKFVANGHTEDELRRGPGGMYGSHEAFKFLVDATSEKRKALKEAMLDHDFFIGAVMYEMGNHEYQINCYQGNWDVLNCFSEDELEYDDYNDRASVYFDQLGWNDDQRHWFWEARKKYLKLCDENDWY